MGLGKKRSHPWVSSLWTMLLFFICDWGRMSLCCLRRSTQQLNMSVLWQTTKKEKLCNQVLGGRRLDCFFVCGRLGNEGSECVESDPAPPCPKPLFFHYLI